MSKKGITPVVGTSLLILIAVSAITTSALFLRDTTGDIKDNVNQQLQKEEKVDRSGIDIEYAYKNTNDNVALNVRNTGEFSLIIEEEDEKIWNLYNDGKPVDFTYASGSTDEKIIDPGSTVTLDTDVSFPSSGDFVTLSIEGRYETSSSIVCDNTDGDGKC